MTHQKRRTAAALAGVSFAIVLLFVQLGFYDMSYRAATMVYDQFAFDILLSSPQYVYLRASGSIPRARVIEAKGVPGVINAAPLYVGNDGTWRNPDDRSRHEILVIGVDPSNPSFALPELIEHASALRRLDVALMDVRAHRTYGNIRDGVVSEMQGLRIEVAHAYSHGTGYVADASMIVSDRTLVNHVPGARLEAPALGLVTIAPEADVEAVAAELRQRLPDDVTVRTRAQLEADEQRHFVRGKPLGIMFGCGVLLAFSVGVVLLYQILATEVANHVREFATLIAIGYSEKALLRIVLEEAGYFVLLAYVPAVACSLIIYFSTWQLTNLPMVMTVSRLLTVLLFSAMMCGAAALLAGRRVAAADPADLF